MKTRYVAQLLLLSAVWGISFLMIRIADVAFPPVWVGLLRSMTGAAFLWIVLLMGRKKLPPRRLFLWLFLVALTNNALPFFCFAWGERIVPSSVAAVINGTTPIWTLLLSLAVTKTRAQMHTIFGVLLGFAGVAIVVTSQQSDNAGGAGQQQLLGAAVIALGALGYAIATVIAKAKLQGLDPIGLATTQLSLSALMLSPVALIGPHPTQIPLSSVLAVLVLGLAGSGIAYLLYYNLLAHVSATQVVAVTYLLPLWGMVWGSVAHESIAPIAYAGAAIVVLGLVLLNRRPAPKPTLQEA
ncbi:DMT family transporter [Terriglobus sp. TAA 43]|uniref:DMT family transporter n=1 Tax=Terriglobus sp. TAA 43 TaxID=278961 RepID=UPI000648DF88|nr:EamA family transporter [Terriglobus sp. TAA 43]